jgi:deoxyribose-phosphate aldolase
MDPVQLAPYIDHTLLKPEASQEKIDALCDEARQFGFASVCVLPFWVRRCAARLRESNVKVCTVVGFPLGAHATKLKALETEQAIIDGAQEIDMVINLGALKSGQFDLVREDIEAVVSAAQEKAVVKVIIETSLLTQEEKVTACQIALQTGADFVKTSTGFSGQGATVEDVRLIKKIVQDRVGIKASGGIRSYEQALAMIRAGATRLGTSSGTAIILSAR